MKKLALLAVVLALPLFAFGQVAASQFSLNASALSLSNSQGTMPVADVGARFAITSNFELRNDNLVASGIQSYFGGVNYAIPQIAQLLAKTNLNPQNFRFYVTGSAGVANVASSRVLAALAGGGFEYSPGGNGQFALSGEARWAKIPGFNNSTVIVSFGPTLTF